MRSVRFCEKYFLSSISFRYRKLLHRRSKYIGTSSYEQGKFIFLANCLECLVDRALIFKGRYPYLKTFVSHSSYNPFNFLTACSPFSNFCLYTAHMSRWVYTYFYVWIKKRFSKIFFPLLLAFMFNFPPIPSLSILLVLLYPQVRYLLLPFALNTRHLFVSPPPPFFFLSLRLFPYYLVVYLSFLPLLFSPSLSFALSFPHNFLSFTIPDTFLFSLSPSLPHFSLSPSGLSVFLGKILLASSVIFCSLLFLLPSARVQVPRWYYPHFYFLCHYCVLCSLSLVLVWFLVSLLN